MRFAAPGLACFYALEHRHWRATAIDPNAARSPRFADAQVDLSAIHMQHRMIPLGDGFGFLPRYSGRSRRNGSGPHCYWDSCHVPIAR